MGAIVSAMPGTVAVLRRRTLKVPERTAILLVAVLLVAIVSLADDTKPRVPDGSASSATKANAAATASVPLADNTTVKAAPGSTESTPAATAPEAAATPANSPAPAPPESPSAAPNSGAGKSNAAMAADEDSDQPYFTPMPALDGNPGLYTLETGETLPKHGWSLGLGLNKFSRMPGDITSLQLIPSIGYGVSHWFSIFFQMNAYDYIHVGAPSLLSLSSASAANPQYQNTIYKSIIPSSGFRRLRGGCPVRFAQRQRSGRIGFRIQNWAALGAAGQTNQLVHSQ